MPTHPKLEAVIAGVVDRGDDSAPWRLLAQLVGGGQRIRPGIVMALGENSDLESGLLQDAAAMELVHLSTLIHDDVIDGACVRRGVPTLNAAFGDEFALLIGNIVKDHALSIATPAAVHVLNAASMDVNRGQLLETSARGQSLAFDRLLPIQLLKTARAFRHCVRLASLHRATPFDDNTEIAMELAALAFQAVDDWLDLAPSADQTQKDSDRDVANGVPSFVRVTGFGSEQSSERSVTEAMAALAGLTTDLPLATLGPQTALTHVLRYCERLHARSLALAGGGAAENVLERLYAAMRVRALAVDVERPSVPA